MVSRTQAGGPLAPIQTEPIAGTDPRTAKQNQFIYESDPVGARCPFGAHVRRTNLYNSDFPRAATQRTLKAYRHARFRSEGILR